MLSHQLPVLPPLNDFWDALPEIFTWMTSGGPVPQRAIIQHGTGEVAIRTRLLPIGVPLPARSTLEIIRFAAANHLCVFSPMTEVTDALSRIRCARRRKVILCCMPSAQIQGSTVRIAWTGCRARLSHRRFSRRVTRLN
jgi:hypothetical protein